MKSKKFLTTKTIKKDILKSFDDDKTKESAAAEMFFGPTSQALIAVEEMKKLRRN